MNKNKKRQCIICGKDFLYKHIKHKCCSRKCAIKSRTGITSPNPVIIKCSECNREYTVKKSKADKASIKNITLLCSLTCKKKWLSKHYQGKNNPNYGNQWTMEQKKIASDRVTDKMRQGRFFCGATKSGKREDLNSIYFRSSWEANYARILNLQNIEWQYEPRTFNFTGYTRGAISYTPDFYVQNNKWIEVKGHLDSKSRTKILRFKKQYPEEYQKLEFVISKYSKKAKDWFEKHCADRPLHFYQDLKSMFCDIIPNWEK